MTSAARDAVLPVDKHPGPTSHDVVARARRALGIRKIGHTGTLDPFASGLMLLCVGKATRIAEYLTGMPKTYEATARLGVRTETLDTEGSPTGEAVDPSAVTEDAIEDALAALRGPIDQVPPQYSAKKVGGVAMHRRARQGEQVVLEPRRVVVHELVLLSWDGADLRFRVRCSSGTYVRALARDVGDSLSVGAHLTALRRTSVGAFDVADALDQERLDDPEAVAGAWLDPLAALAHLPRVDVDAAGAATLGFGKALEVAETPDAELVAVAWDDTLAALGSVEGGLLKPRKVFVG
ncbi:MAG: tRNA pseudouridine(55) synthase TruB [Longimicrobiales bacterium]